MFSLLTFKGEKNEHPLYSCSGPGLSSVGSVYVRVCVGFMQVRQMKLRGMYRKLLSLCGMCFFALRDGAEQQQQQQADN